MPAMPGLTAGVVVGCLSALHMSVMFLIGSWLGPFVLWFLQPVSRFLPAVSGVSFVLVLLIAAARLSDNWWTTATCDSKSLGEIPLAEAGRQEESRAAWSVPDSAAPP